MRHIFRSDHLPLELRPNARARAWAEGLMAGGYNGEAVIPIIDQNFFGAIELSAPGRTMIARSHANSLILTRRAEHIISDLDDRIMLFFNHGAAPMRTVQLGHEVFIQQGEGVFLTQENTQVLDGTHSGNVVTVILPRDLIADWKAAPQDFAGKRHDLNTSRYRLLRGYCQLLAEEGSELEGGDIGFITQHIADLMSNWLGAERFGDDPSQDATLGARYIAIKHLMRRHFSDPNLTLTHIASALAISPRMVQHILSKNGDNFLNLLARLRCEKALQYLSDQGFDHISIEQIAYFCGFGDYSVFFKAFKRLYDASPTEHRKIRGT